MMCTPVFFIGIDPGIANIGVCAVDANATVVASDVFSIQRGSENVDEIYLDPNFYIARLKEQLHARIFTKLASLAANAQVFAVIELQYKCQYAVILGWLLAALAEVGIQTQVHRCYSVRAGLGIPPRGRSALLKKNVLLYTNAAGFNTNNHHIGDAFTLAMYCRQCVAKLEGKLVNPPTWAVAGETTTATTASAAKTTKKKQASKKASSEAAKRKREKPTAKKAKVSKRGKCT